MLPKATKVARKVQGNITFNKINYELWSIFVYEVSAKHSCGNPSFLRIGMQQSLFRKTCCAPMKKIE